MENSTNQQLAQMMDEIQSIKNIIHQKKPLLRIVLHPRHLKISMLLTGISILILSFVFYYLEQHYGSYSLSPTRVQDIYIWLVVIVGITLFILFFVLWLKSLRKNGEKFTGEDVWSVYFSFRVVNILLPMEILTYAIIMYCIKQDMTYYIIPVLSIVAGLSFNFLGCITEMKNYIIGGYWYLITAGIIFLSNSIPGSLAVMLSLGCGSLVFGLLPNSEK